MSAPNISQVSRVRALYKAILRIHRGLPLQMKAMGDQYVKDEFKRHKDAPPLETGIFMDEWTKYYLTIGKQLAARKKVQTIGVDLSPELLDCFQNDQVAQLYELFKETNKPLNDDDN
ncbi:succinate dehydrogenase assembly factor 3, mitochondrial-like [Mytilus galloprovincialis]|uniref:succinate dehydrogenase assembly factor 3, mitochondrial-like n=1 Tax=Mytilus edulis TaxID=6550 RepID=UPI0039EF1F30